tara:strand:+ start:48 stop:221 length:174 start_codon:yes stop_codon:yes gene_type:complete
MEKLTVKYLMELHKISEKDAKCLKCFAKKNTITYKECYGNGSIIYPMWKEEQYTLFK